MTLALVAATVAAGAVAVAADPVWVPSGLLEIHSINVQQGAATLVIGPDGTTVLLDAGDNGKGPQITAYLMGLGLSPAEGLDYTIASHLDADHIGGFDEVLAGGYDVLSENWYNGSPRSSATVDDYKAAAAATTAGAPIPAVLDDSIDLGNGASLKVLAVAGTIIGHGAVTGAENNENDMSIAILIEYGDFDYIWAGDLGGGDDDGACTGRSTSQVNLETPLAQAITPGGGWPLLSVQGVDVLHVNHHGSESSTNSDYMNRLRPEVAIIAVGAGQGYNWYHPRIDVVEKVLLAEAGACVTAPPVALVLQTEEGSPTGSGTSFAGYAVGDVKISTDGVTGYLIEADGAVSQGPDERAAAGLPRVFPLDESSSPSPKVILSEVFYDAPAGDDGWEWVELFNNGPAAVDLSGFCLGNGGSDYTYSRVQLAGTIAPFATFVVGGPSSGPANANPSFDLALNFNPDFQNSGATGDGVALFDVPCGSVHASTVPVDAVVYGPNNGNGLIDETGAANAPEVGDAPEGASIERVGLAGSWQIRVSPSPNSTELPSIFSDGFESGDVSAWSWVVP